MIFNDSVEVIGKVIDGCGVTAILVGSGVAAGQYLGRRQRRPPDVDYYGRFRQQLGRSVLLGLELLVAGDIIRTVAATPTLTSIAVLAGIVVIRTFLSFSIELEVGGRWPWQRQPTDRARESNADAAVPARGAVRADAGTRTFQREVG
ncbi:MAG TPA: DUF1622 domain-containing protein [Chloroflexota bacterium]